MTDQFNRLSRPAGRRSSLAACLMLVAISWLQLTVAEHRFEHLDADAAGYCDVCLKLDRLDDGIAPIAAATAAPYADAVVYAGVERGAQPVGAAATYSPRAPPLI